MRARLLALAAGLAAAAASCQAAPEPAPHQERPPLGLMTTLPLIWAETGAFGDLLAAEAAGGSWVKPALEARFTVEPLDALDAGALARLDRLVLAQPRPLGPAENVALDDWVRAGGRVLVLADPMLTRHSRYAVGDPRRPQDVALLSPILSRWGLDLRFDDTQPEGERVVEGGGLAIPVNLAGQFALAPGASCTLAAQGLLANCRIGKGRVVAMADAALLDDVGDAPAADRGASLARLLALSFD